MRESTPFWLPGPHGARRPYLVARGKIAAALRAWFAKADFIEVETATLQVSPGNETHLHAFATELIGPDTATASALSADLAGIRLQEAAGRRRDPHFRFRPRVPQSRARRTASPRVHHAGMVSRERALRDADGRLRGAAGGSGARRRFEAVLVSRQNHRSVCSAGTRDGGGSLRTLRRRRSAGDGERRRGRSRRGLRRPPSKPAS